MRRHLGTIFGCFEILSAGIKPAFVWDFFPADLQQLLQAVAHLKEESLVHPETTVLALAQGVGTPNSIQITFSHYFRALKDLFVVRQDMLLQNLTRQVVIIDVSGARPEIADRSSDVQVISVAVKAALQVESRLVEASGPALMGLLLGYPIVYWLRPDAGENCLGSVPLAVFKVHGEHCKTARDHFVTSFSVPVEILGDEIRV